MALIEMQKIEMIYGKGEGRVHALHDIHLQVEKGDFVAIVGKSGCGKSTLLNILGAVSKPTAGSYFLNGTDVVKLNPTNAARFRNENIGFVVQHFALIQELTVRENIGLPLVYQSCKKNEIRKRVDKVLQILEIEDKSRCYPSQLSGGQCQRVAIARALITNPKVILADEPTGALDEETGKNVMQIFSRLNQTGTTILFVTHDKEIAQMCKRVIRMRDGKIIESPNA